jgi:hypothetical protein
MGCHTWCAYKVERTIDEARKIWIDVQEKNISEWKAVVNNPDDECRVIYGWTQEYMEGYLKIYERQLRMVKNGLCNVAVMNKQPEHSYYREGKGFFINCEQHSNQFRIGGYPEDEIFSKEECMKFIEKNKDKIQFFEQTYEWLDEFWNKYPDGFMNFG